MRLWFSCDKDGRVGDALMRLGAIVIIAAACSSESARAPAPMSTPPLPAPVATADAMEAEPRIDSPMTRPREYDAAQCNQRIAKMTQRLTAASDELIASFDLDHHVRLARVTDSGVSSALQVWLVGDTKDPCAPYSATIVVGGKTVATYSGTRTMEKTLAAAKQYARDGSIIALGMQSAIPVDLALPLALELQKIGPLALRVAVEGAWPQMPLDDAPAWAIERYRAIERAPESHAWVAGILDASSECLAMKVAADRVSADLSNNQSAVIAAEYPKAAAACACKNMDVDALELFTLVMLRVGVNPLREGFLDVRIDPKSARRLTSTTAGTLVDELAKMPRDVRRAGFALVPEARCNR